jgi:hypothetical protein
VLPPRALPAAVAKINPPLLETIAWPKLVALVAREYDALPRALLKYFRRHCGSGQLKAAAIVG